MDLEKIAQLAAEAACGELRPELASADFDRNWYLRRLTTVILEKLKQAALEETKKLEEKIRQESPIDRMNA